ncbi:MAG: glycoside hydrolase family 3 N-terminal domain-containing protein [Bilifractor sp.]
MNEQDFWASIPHGKNDPPMLLWDITKPMPYDFNEPDSQYVMFNRELAGCIAVPFTKRMTSAGGETSVDGKPVSSRICTVTLAGYEGSWLAIKPGGYLHDYGLKHTVEVSGFTDTDGNAMVPVKFQVETISNEKPDPAYASHEKIALEAAQDGIVLLKNNRRTLPLPEGSVLNFFGSGVFAFRLCAVGAGKIFPRYARGLLEAAREEKTYRVNDELCRFYACGVDRIPSGDILRRAREQSDTAIMVISRACGEGIDNSTKKGEYYLSDEEESLLLALREHFSRLVVILNVGYPISTAFAEKYRVDALVYNGIGGMLAGRALMDVLSGRVNPSGKLPDTWSEDYEAIPSARNFYDCGEDKKRILTDDKVWINTVYEEDIFMGYRYFETFPNADRAGYPFGFGLSYTTFKIAGETCAYNGKELSVEVSVENTGDVPGREVVQLYLSKPEGDLEQPARELIAYQKTKLLAPGEREKITLTVPDSRMTSYDERQAAYVMVSGEYQVLLGNCVRSAERIGSFSLSDLKLIKKVKNRMRLNMALHTLKRSDPEKTLPTGRQSGVVDGASGLQEAKEELEQFDHALLPKTDKKLTFRDVLKNPSLLPQFVGNMDVKTLARIAVCASDGWGMEGRGEAGRLYRPSGTDLPEMVVADGNSGVNLKTRNIGMPSGATLCASFDRSLMEQVGRAVGEEAKELGISLILAPALNLHRNPLNGRQPEYFSEDPYLAGSMAGCYCRGLESSATGGCYKHLIANNAESSRKRNQSVVSERAIRELYFRAFEYALEEHEPVSVMTAYNAVNGVFTSCDPELLQGLLFEECGFSGFVMTDWTSYDSADVVQMEKAGNTWITPGSEDDTYTGQIEEAVADGRLPLAQLQENVLRMIRALVRMNPGGDK